MSPLRPPAGTLSSPGFALSSPGSSLGWDWEEGVCVSQGRLPAPLVHRCLADGSKLSSCHTPTTSSSANCCIYPRDIFLHRSLRPKLHCLHITTPRVPGVHAYHEWTAFLCIMNQFETGVGSLTFRHMFGELSFIKPDCGRTVFLGPGHRSIPFCRAVILTGFVRGLV